MAISCTFLLEMGVAEIVKPLKVGVHKHLAMEIY